MKISTCSRHFWRMFMHRTFYVHLCFAAELLIFYAFYGINFCQCFCHSTIVIHHTVQGWAACVCVCWLVRGSGGLVDFYIFAKQLVQFLIKIGIIPCITFHRTIFLKGKENRNIMFTPATTSLVRVAELEECFGNHISKKILSIIYHDVDIRPITNHDASARKFYRNF